MEETTHIPMLLKYLEILSNGKIRPDRQGGGTVRDAKDNMPEIAAVKTKLNSLFNLKVEPAATSNYNNHH